MNSGEISRYEHPECLANCIEAKRVIARAVVKFVSRIFIQFFDSLDGKP
jgi:hypothetical protein